MGVGTIGGNTRITMRGFIWDTFIFVWLIALKAATWLLESIFRPPLEEVLCYYTRVISLIFVL